MAHKVEHYLGLGLYTKCALIVTADTLSLDFETVEKAWIATKLNNGGVPVR